MILLLLNFSGCTPKSKVSKYYMCREFKNADGGFTGSFTCFGCDDIKDCLKSLSEATQTTSTTHQ